MNKEEFEGRNFFVGKIEEIKIDVFETVTKINQYVKELERLARIGKATEKVFEDGYVLANNNGRYVECNDIYTIEELIKGLESED